MEGIKPRKLLPTRKLKNPKLQGSTRKEAIEYLKIFTEEDLDATRLYTLESSHTYKRTTTKFLGN